MKEKPVPKTLIYIVMRLNFPTATFMCPPGVSVDEVHGTWKYTDPGAVEPQGEVVKIGESRRGGESELVDDGPVAVIDIAQVEQLAHIMTDMIKIGINRAVSATGVKAD